MTTFSVGLLRGDVAELEIQRTATGLKLWILDRSHEPLIAAELTRSEAELLAKVLDAYVVVPVRDTEPCAPPEIE